MITAVGDSITASPIDNGAKKFMRNRSTSGAVGTTRGTHGSTLQTDASNAAETRVVDAATLYMILTLADGSRHTMALQYRFATAAQCQRSLPYWEKGHTAEGYRQQGAHVRVYCGAPTKPLIIAR